MPDINNPLSAISYTNKDFRDIYPELLDLVKKLTYKWDPSISNESDPGVILLKLNAIIADKNNYNIDKNVLEVFPETLTQEVSARTMYHQLSYEMPWYRSATTEITLKWVGRDLTAGEQVHIPMYTMVCDSDSKFIYTLVNDVYFTPDSLTTMANAIQGIVTTVEVNGESTISLVNLDHNNRLYLDDYSVAENGIFITNVGEYNPWTRVNNLAVQTRGNTYYEFGVDGRTNNCYIEFPDDIESLIKDGLNIKYMLSDGREGNVSAKMLTSFYEETSIKVGTDTITLNSDSVVLYNSSATKNGDDPQEISEAYKSYKKYAGTFETLVTLRDYIDAIYTQGLVSNVVVSDRNNDLQCSYSIVTDKAGAGTHTTVVTKNENNEPNMLAFDLKLYLLQNGGDIGTLDDYEATFNMIPSQSSTTQSVKLTLQQTKCITHDFKDIEKGSPCLFRIAYPLRIKIVPQYKLTDMQQDSVKVNIISALLSSLNSHEVEFGQEPSYDVIYDTITNADERIKLVILDDFNYTTYATYWTGTQFKNIPLCNYNSDPYIYYSDANTYSGMLKDFDNKVNSINSPEKLSFVGNYLQGDIRKPNSIYKYNKTTKTFEPYSVEGEVDNFREQIIIKSVLAGVTPLFEQEVIFNYTIDQQVIEQTKDVDRMTTKLTISPFGLVHDDNTNSWGPKQLPENNTETAAEYTLKDNETLQFLAPSFVTKRNFSNYVTYQFIKQKTDSDTVQKVSLSWQDYQSNPAYYTQLFTEDYDYQYVTLYNSKTGFNLLDKQYLVPVYQDNVYYSNNGSLVDSYPGDPDTPSAQNPWGTGDFYYDAELTRKVDFTINPSNNKGLTFLQAWQQNNVGVFWETYVLSVPANTDYKLSEGDSLTLFWTEDNSSTAPYTYECYKGSSENDSPIIRASFTLNSIPATTSKINVNALSNTGYIPYNSANDSAYSKVYSMTGRYALSGTQTIDIRGINETNIKQNDNYIYFVTNDVYTNPTGTEYFRMVLNKKSTNNNMAVYEYVLKTDEYFIYTNLDKTEYEILGQGTLIRFTGEDNGETTLTQEVVSVDYNLIATQGIAVFENVCKLLPYNCLLREQQLYNFTSGDTVRIELDKEYTSKNYTNFPVFSTGTETFVNDFKISYSTNGSTYTELPGIQIQSEETIWRGTAILNIDSSSTEPQIIDNYWLNNDGTKMTRKSIQIFEILGTQYPDNEKLKGDSLIYMLTNTPLTRTGGENVDVSYVTIDGIRKSLEVLIYEKNKQFLTNGYSYYNNQVSLSTTTIGEHPVTGISLQSDFDYLLGVNNNGKGVRFKLQIKHGNTVVSELLNGNEDEFLGSEHPWYYKIHGNDLTNLTMIITTDSVDETGLILFDDLLKYQDNKIFEQNYGLTVDTILEDMQSYRGHDKFKYNYNIPETLKIEDPILGKTFFNENHIFSKYALAEAVLKPPVERDSKNNSIISIVNNR
nr:MAG TPA: Baseplate wedge protein [Caudoviricetes sp.]